MAPSPRRFLCFGVLSLFGSTLLCNGFNIDDRFPVIKEGKNMGSLFGFSVALHKQTVGSEKYLLLAGAPKEMALALKGVNETGAVYSCPVTKETTDCSRMDLVTTTNPIEERVEGMWLGVTVASQRALPAGHVLACGHRYVTVKSSGAEVQWRMVGKCFVVGNDLTSDPDDLWQDYREYCNANEDMEAQGMCSMGISGGFTDTEVYIGSPGSFTWQGNVHITWRNPDPDNPWDTEDSEFKEPTKSYNYMGYSVLQEQHVLHGVGYTVVTGSPRDQSKGSVTLAKRQGVNIAPLLVIPGEQVGSYFGNSLAVTDLNNDGFNDLMVGAPFYFDRSKEHGGAVYVYMNENGSFRKEPSLVLKGPLSSGFGIALAAIGDVNQDGFQDFAVGAPFHGTGKVFIWMGSKEGISEKFSQVIEGKSVGDGKFKTFGYSLNGGMDMDENSYPDLLVGSLDDRIALLRTRPVVHLSIKDFNVTPKIVEPKCSPAAGKACIRVKVCFSYTLSNGNKSLKKNVVVRYTVEADVDKWRSRRVFFRSKSNATYTGTVTLTSPDAKCHKLELDVAAVVSDKLQPVVFELSMALEEQKPTQQGLQDLDSFPILSHTQKTTKRTEINFAKACGTDNTCSSNLKLTAVYADDTERPFSREGQAQEQVMLYDRSVKKVVIIVEVTNRKTANRLAEDAHQAELNVTIPKTLSYSGVRSQEDDPIECRTVSQGAGVVCDLGNPLAGGDVVNLRLIFETQDIDMDTQQIETLLQLSTLSEQDDLVPVPLVLKVEISILAAFAIQQPHVQTYFSGEVMGESAMKSSADVGSLVEYTFSVEVLGTSMGTMGTLAIQFDWPLEVENGKWLLYLTEVVMNGTSETHCVPPGGVINPLQLKLVAPEAGAGRRTRRQAVLTGPRPPATVPPAEQQQQAVATLLSSRKEAVILDCASGKARCVTFTCPLRDMQTQATLTVRSRVWNSTLLEDYSKALRVTVKGKASLHLITDKPSIKMQSETREFSVDIDPVLGEEAPYEVPLWIILVAAGAGVLLLGFISLLLWKCGFFRRANRREMYEAKDQKAEMKIQPSETEKLTEDY